MNYKTRRKRKTPRAKNIPRQSWLSERSTTNRAFGSESKGRGYAFHAKKMTVATLARIFKNFKTDVAHELLCGLTIDDEGLKRRIYDFLQFGVGKLHRVQG